jgi:lipoprotein-anchoring transpeptidase ErfK/SrfK
MTRLEYYSSRIIVGIIIMLIALGMLIVWTIMRGIPPQTPALVATTIVPGKDSASTTKTLPPPPPPTVTTSATSQLSYLTVTSSCDYAFADECVRVRSAPGIDSRVVGNVRNGMVLRAETDNPIMKDGVAWYKIRFDETLRYPERVKSDWYISSEYTVPFETTGPETATGIIATTTKRIVIDRSDQTLKAYEGDAVILDITISTGRELTPTPRGEFTVYYKTPTRYMQGPLPGISNQYYDLPGVPWNLYFTKQGAVIHGAYWHESYGTPYSNGCVNVPLEYARTIYEWADLGTKVIVRD